MSRSIVDLLRTASVIPDGVRASEVSLPGGYWNEVIRIDLDDGRRWVAKRFSATSDNPYFPVDPDLEAGTAAILAGTGLAADPVAYLPEHRLLVTEFLDGPGWDGSTVPVSELLRMVHAIDPGPQFRRLAVGSDEIVAHGLRVLDWGGAELDIAPPRVRHPGRSGSLVHTDCGPGNMIATASGLRLIDWQCPGRGDPVEDLACFASPAIQILFEHAPLTDPQLQGLLEGYDDPETMERFHRLRPAYHWRIAAYCRARQHRLRATDPEVSARYGRALAAETALLEELS